MSFVLSVVPVTLLEGCLAHYLGETRFQFLDSQGWLADEVVNDLH